ncbi:hypothetical protein NDU88_003889 [Pleurodeles waltl]|uniref:Uncharacterized protein n=1 Tax=Pleurodeles waltl TaxID=8319 RepID=A0AAV7WW40_PLEWA|nr:hypothetical protein NDU88_003889 [Pleurodeles waltl]
MTSPDHRGPQDSRFPLHRHSPTLTFHPLVTPAQHPPSGPKPPYPGQVNQRCVHHYREPRVTHHPTNNRDLGAVVVGTRSRGRRHRNTGELERAAVRQGADRPREPTLHEALSSIMGAYHHSQETMATVRDKLQETLRLQEEQYLGFREELRTISSALGTIVGVLKDIQQTLRDTVALQGAPDPSQDDEMPTTSAGASGQDARHRTTTPAPRPLQTGNHHASGP